MNVLNCTVRNSICIGCEICEAMCKTDCISFNDQGDMDINDKCSDCGICVKYCPSISANRNDREEQLQERMKGKCIKSFVGRVKDLTLLRKTVSGGFVTGTIHKLLENGVYEYAIGVESVSVHKKLEMKIYNLTTWTDSITKSVYVMPLYKEVIQYIKTNNTKI